MLEKEKEGRLLGLHREFFRIIKEYRTVFSADAVPEMSIKHAKDWKQEKKFLVNSLMGHLDQVFDDIHRADTVIDWVHIGQTEDSFRGLCRLTHSMIVLATEMHREVGEEIPDYSKLAESALFNLITFQSERALLVDTISGPKPDSLQSSQSPRKEETPSQSSSIQGWIKGMLGGFAGSAPVEEKPEPKVSMAAVFDEAGMAHTDPTLGATQQLFRVVLESIASAGQHDAESSDETSTSEEGDAATPRGAYAKTAKRMIELIQAMPPTWIPEPLIVDQVLAVLSRVGTLESAGECYEIFRKHPSPNRLRFSTVLEAYVEAAKYEQDQKRRETIVKNAIGALHQTWNKNLPGHRVDRINVCSVVLHCVSAAGISSLPDMCEEADKLVKRALGTASYAAFLSRIASKKGRVDAQALRLVHFLVQIYASSGDERRLEDAQRMLEYMIQKDTEGVGIFIVFPNIDTFNSVLQGLQTKLNNNTSEPRDNVAAQEDMEYAMGLLDYMLTSTEVGCWPSEATFALLFRLLSQTRLPDAGERAEELLSKMEIRKSFPGSYDVKISLSAYHEALRCWLEVAKSSPSGVGVCDNAVRLLDRLDVQSTPLLFNDEDARGATQRISLYDIDLRPNRSTYILLLQICGAVQDPAQKERTAEIAAGVYQRMIAAGISPTAVTDELLERGSL